MTRWGLSATIKAPVAETLHFAAYHLERGAHRLYLYLDDANAETYKHLKTHPKIRPILCDDAWWQGKRPKKHQVRQSQNATHAYHRKADVDWLIHMDVDEFLVPDRSIVGILDALPPKDLIARIRPMEQLSGDGRFFKAFIPNGPDRPGLVKALYPTFGTHIKGGFLSHLAGKIFVRTGLPEVKIQIHNAFQHTAMINGPEDTDGLSLAHCHAPTWDKWRAAYAFRLAHGSYRAELAPNRPRERGGLSMNDLFTRIEQDGGETALRAMFDEVCADGPQLRQRLAAHGVLREVDLALNDQIVAHFPSYTT